MTNNNGKKEYTFLNMKKSVGSKGNYISCTAECLVVRPDTQMRITNSGKNCISFSTPIKGRTQYIESMVGTRPVEDNTGTVWATVTMFDNGKNDLASRFHKLISNAIAQGNGLVLMITGSINVVINDKNGQRYVNCNITADSFFVHRSFKKNGNSAPAPNNNATAQGYGQQNGQPYNAAPQQGYQQPPQNYQPMNNAPQQSYQPANNGYQNQNGMPAPNPAGYSNDIPSGFIAIPEDDDIPF